MKELSPKWIDKMTASEKDRYFATRKSSAKVKGLAADIFTECQRQNFTIEELEMLGLDIIAKYDLIIRECKKQVARITEYSSNPQNANHP